MSIIGGAICPLIMGRISDAWNIQRAFLVPLVCHDSRDQKEWTIESHTTIVMDKIKKAVETGGGTVDTILQANVFLTKIEHWDGMHKVFSKYFPHGGPSRTTVAVAALPGDSLVEINCIAAVAHK